MTCAAGLPEPIRELDLLRKLIVDEHLTFIVIFFIIIFLWLQDFSNFTWLQGLNTESLVQKGAWVSVPLPPRHLRAQCKPPASSNPWGQPLSWFPQDSWWSSFCLSSGRVSSKNPGSAWKPTPREFSEAWPLRWDPKEQQSLKTREGEGLAKDKDTGVIKNWKPTKWKHFLESALDNVLLPTSPADLLGGSPMSSPKK